VANYPNGIGGVNLVSAQPLAEAGYGYDSATVSDQVLGPVNAGMKSLSNLARPVYCVLGLPIDAVNMATVIRRVDAAAANRAPLLLSTPNMNFLVGSLSDPEFRESILNSDLCPPDGAPIVWIARLLGLPIKERVAGSDLLDELRGRPSALNPLTIFLFGGAKGIAEAAAKTLNAQPSGLTCVGTMDPGFCEIDQMSKDDIIDALNSSGADFLMLALGAKKGQLWLQRNQSRLTIPIRAHLGAAMNFQAGSISRAPPLLRTWGLEWLWRIKEEHYLWRRYRDDALVLLRLLLTRILPLAIISRWYRLRCRAESLLIKKTQAGQSILISLSGVASEEQILPAISCFEDALAYEKNIVFDLSNLELIDARFLGLLLMLRKELKTRKAKLFFTGVSRSIKRIFCLSELEFLLSSPQPG
jgi:N-acetylglucosaminyldiphosphoundecaprenol N-acetyl-beta-D-mannosaminyltransferase